MDEKDLLETSEQEVVEDVDTAASDAVEQELTDAVVCDNCEESDEYKNAAVLSADELETFVGQLDDSVNELGEIVEEMNVITSDEDSESQESNNEQGKSRQSIQKTILSYLHDIAFGMVAILVIFMLVFRVVVVSGPSMKQTLQHGDCLVLLNSVFYREPKVGDIVVATKSSYKDGEPIIKRVIATEGQVVDIDFEKGIVYVDGKALDEPYVNTPTNLYEGVSFPLTVKENCVFVMGDNRNDSKDSRSSEIGQIDRRELLGKALFLVVPGVTEDVGEREFDRIGVLW